jgi:hypothetical protein
MGRIGIGGGIGIGGEIKSRGGSEIFMGERRGVGVGAVAGAGAG